MSDTHHKSEIAAHGDRLTGGDGDGPVQGSGSAGHDHMFEMAGVISPIDPGKFRAAEIIALQ